jgi:hypothetical protein
MEYPATMKQNQNDIGGASRRCAAMVAPAIAALALWSPTASLEAALPTPVIDFDFAEGSGTTAANAGSLAGSATLNPAHPYPLFTNNVPTGVFAPTGNTASLDFGAIAAGEGGRAVDLMSGVGDGTIGVFSGFTICGWLNARDLNQGWGGNRIAFVLAWPDGPGFDLVQLGNGALRLGINQWPDGANGGGPQSTAGRVTADLQLSDANWVFFAVTYDGTSAFANTTFYFGSATQAAFPDVTADYDCGAILTSGALTVGNFGAKVGARNDAGTFGSRCFRGLLDELRVFNRVLTPAEIQAVQREPTGVPTVPVALSASPEGGEMVPAWESSAPFQLQARTALETGDWANEPTPPVSDGNRKTVRLPVTGPSRFFRLISQ